MHHMIKSSLSVLAALSFCLAETSLAHPIITDVVETGGDNEATDTVTAKWTGVTFVNGVAGEPIPGSGAGDSYTVGLFGNGAPSYVDRNHHYTNASGTVLIPAYLADGEYIMSGNDNRDNASYTLDVTVSQNVDVYLLIDNRLGSDNTTPPALGPGAMQWVLDEGWTPVTTGANRTSNSSLPDEVGIDEGADGSINQWFSVYTKFFPAGTFQLKQADNPGNNMYGAVVQAAGPVSEAPPRIEDRVPRSGELTYDPADGISFRAVTFSPNTIDPSDIHLFLNGTDVSGVLNVTGNTTNRMVTYSALQGNVFYDAEIVVIDNMGRATTNRFNFDTLGAGGVIIENEDYNYGVDSFGDPVIGLCLSPGDPPPFVSSGGGFQDDPPPSGFNSNNQQVNGNGVGCLDLTAVSEVDFSDTTSATGPANNSYRTCTPVGVQQSGDFDRAKYVQLDLEQWDLELQQVQAGEWLNYTRTFPASNFRVYLRTRAAAAQEVLLSRVTSDRTQPGQTTAALGTFEVPATVGYQYVPLTDIGSGQPLVISLTGVQTVRLTASDASGNLFPNFLVFVPTSDPASVLGPVVSSTTPAEGETVSGDTAVSAVILNRDTSVDVGSIQMRVNGTNVSANATPTGTGANVTYNPPSRFKSGSTNMITLIFSDNLGRFFTNDWTFLVAQAAFVQDSGPGGLLVFEAEHFVRNLGGRWTVNTTRGTPSGGASVVVPSGGGNSDAIRVEYDVIFTHTGRHIVWYRASGDSGNDDSSWFVFDGARPENRTASNDAAMTGFSTQADFVWRSDAFTGADPFDFNVNSTGVHTIGLGLREDGSFFDKFIITTDPNFVPTGFGPPESPREGAPVVNITSPSQGQVFPDGSDVTITAEATAPESPPITLIEFFDGTNKIAEATSSPASHTLNNLSNGVYTNRVVATDSAGQKGSATVTFTVGDVIPPMVMITSPTDGTTFTSGSSIPVQAAASDDSGIDRVEFLVRGEQVAVDTTAPYETTLSGLSDGVWAITARAVDNTGLTNETTIRVTLGNPPQMLFVVGNPDPLNTSDALIRNRLEELGFAHMILDDAASQTTDADGKVLVIISSTVGSGDVGIKFVNVTIPVIHWEQALQDDFQMSTNNATAGGQTQIDIVNSAHPLAAGLSDGLQTIVTTPSGFMRGVPASSAIIVATVAGNSALAAHYAYDTGALLLDGSSAPGRRIGLPMDDNVYENMNDAGRALFDAAIAWALDIALPSVSITSPADGQVVAPGSDVTINANASSAEGIALVEFFLDDTKVGEDTTSPYTATAMNVPEGRHDITAKATDNRGFTSVAVVQIFADNTPPALLSVGSHDGTTVGLCFSEPLDADSAMDEFNYFVTNGGTRITVTEAQLAPENSAVVILTLASPVSDGFTVDVVGVRDEPGNVVPPGTRGTGDVIGLTGVDLVRVAGTDPANPGVAFSCSNNCVTVMADGSDIWNEADAGYFVHSQRTGDFDVKVQVKSLELTDVWAKATLMARTDLTGGSANVFVASTPQQGRSSFVMQERPVANGPSQRVSGSNEVFYVDASASYPDIWLRLQRMGELFTGFYSTNGMDWVQFAQSTRSDLPSSLFVGLALTSHSIGNTATAEFCNYGEFVPALGPLNIERVGGNVRITWSGPGRLEQAPTVLGPWSDVPGNPSSPYETPASGAMMFYRLISP